MPLLLTIHGASIDPTKYYGLRERWVAVEHPLHDRQLAHVSKSPMAG